MLSRLLKAEEHTSPMPKQDSSMGQHDVYCCNCFEKRALMVVVILMILRRARAGSAECSRVSCLVSKGRPIIFHPLNYANSATRADTQRHIQFMVKSLAYL